MTVNTLVSQWKRIPQMRNAQWALAIALLAGLVAVPVFLYGPPMEVDGPNHFYRLVELNWHVQHGDFYPRWFSDIYYGYGGPVFAFYPPLSYYIALGLHLIGLSLPAAFTAAFVLGMTAGVAGMALWVCEHTGNDSAGLAAAAVYGLSPYFYYNVLVRDALPETLALGLAPWVLWALRRLIVAPSKRTYIGFVVLYAALLLTHNLAALLVTPICLVYGFGLLRQLKAHRKQFVTVGLSFLHAGGLALFYLIPFVAELGWVRLGKAALDFNDHFIPLAMLFSLPVAFDPKLIQTTYLQSIPLVALAAAVLGIVLVWRKSHNDKWLVLAMGGLLVFYGLMTLSISQPIWNLLLIGNLIQFPWRLLGEVMLVLAWLCGMAVAAINNRVVAWGFVAASLLFGLTWSYWYPESRRYPEGGSPADVIQHEINLPAALGLTFQQEFLPKWVSELPSADTVLEQYGLYESQYRLQTPPAGITILRQEATLTGSLVEYDAPEDFTATFHTFYYPGWSATLDGGDVELQPSDPGGLIEVNALAGHHTLQIERESTPDHIFGVLGSLVALLVFLFIRFEPLAASPSEKTVTHSIWPYVFLFGGLFILRVSVLEWVENPFKYTRLYQLADPSMSNVQFGNKLRLLRAIVPTQPQPADQPIETTLYWQALSDLTVDYHVSLQLVDRNGNRFGQSDQFPGLIPTAGLKQDQYGPDTHLLMPLPGIPPGEYTILATVYETTNGAVQSLPLIVDDSEAGVEYELMRLTLTTGWLDGSDALDIEEASIAGETFGVGDSVSFTMLWHTGPTPPSGLRTRFTALDEAEQESFTTEFLPAGEAYPSEQWAASQLIRYPQTIILPPDLPAGPARFIITFVDEQSQAISEPFELGQVTITVPERQFELPVIQYPAEHRFNQSIDLLGYNLIGESLILYWRSLEPVSTPLTVFIHDFNTTGEFLAGRDNPPARTVTSWLPGEIITDTRPLPTGDYFEIGLYNSLTGEPFGTPYTARP
jgi:hypothetical protein